MNSRDYWQKREEEALKHYLKDEASYDKEIKQIYANMLDSVQQQIDSFYGRYATKEGISLAEAKKRVSKLDIAAYERKAKRYVREKNFSKQANEEMRLYNATMKINRMEMLKANIGLELISGHDELEKYMEGILQGRTMEELERQAGILGKTVRNNAKTAHAIVNGSFQVAKVGDQSTFSDRIWQYQDLMREDLGRILQTGLIQGKNPRALAKDLRKYWYGADPLTGGGATYCMERLMRTELARVQTEAQKQSFDRNGFDEYMFISNEHGHTCGHCNGLDGKHFKVKDMMPGKNAPPMHPNCRCSTAAWVDDEEYEAWLDFLDHGGTTAEWKAFGKAAWEKQQKANIPVAKNGNSSKIMMKRLSKLTDDGKIAVPMDSQKYSKIKSSLEANGCSVLSATKGSDDERYLLWYGAEAVCDENGIMHLGEIPSASGFFEEIIHYTQIKKYGVVEESDFIERAAREIAANRKLLKYGRAYGFTEDDFSEIRLNLEIWEADFKERTGISYDESNIKREI